MGVLKVESTSAAKLFLNEKELGLVKKGENQFELEPGVYNIKAKASWCGSKPIQVQIIEDDICYLQLKTFANENMLRVAFFAALLPFFLFRAPAFLIIAGLLLLYPLYYVTFAKDEYLKLIKKENNI